MNAADYHEFRSPLPVRVLSHDGRPWPAGKAAAYGIFRSHLDHHTVWHVCFDEGGQWWEIENPFVRADPNATWGRTLEVPVRVTGKAA